MFEWVFNLPMLVAGPGISSFFFKINDERFQRTVVGLLATLLGMVVFIIVELDRPFRGDLGLPPDSYQLIYDQLMKPQS